MVRMLTPVILCAAAIAFAEPGELLQAPVEHRVAGQYVVVLTDATASGSDGSLSVPEVGADLVSSYGGSILYFYEHALSGFAVRLSEAEARALVLDPRVKYVEEDQLMFASATQPDPSWGLDRIDQRDLPLDHTYTFGWTGLGVHAYILDTGIRATHQEFGGRVAMGFDAVGDGNGTNDCHGHGTHVSGTVGGSSFGVAKEITLHPIRVLGCDGFGTVSGVVAGVDFVTAQHQSPAVANMSLGGGVSQALDDAVNRSIRSGVVYAVAAGNDFGINACSRSPARVAAALTVGSITFPHERSSFSNVGNCVDIFAPGAVIISAWRSSDTSTNALSGTSMATPHVTGAAALLLQASPGLTAAQVADAIISNATTGRITNPGTGSPNRLLFSPSLPGSPWLQHGASTPDMIQYADVDGDHKADALYFDTSRSKCVWVSRSTGSGFETPAPWVCHGGHTVPRKMQYRDVNGDGRADALYFGAGENNTVWVSLSTGSGFLSPSAWLQHGYSTPDMIQYADVDGDHKADALYFDTSRSKCVWVSRSTGSGFETPAPWVCHGGHTVPRKMQYRDVNGDGRADALYFGAGENNIVWVSLSSGSGFLSPWAWLQHGYSTPDMIQYTDVDGDGKADILYFDTLRSSQVWVQISGF